VSPVIVVGVLLVLADAPGLDHPEMAGQCQPRKPFDEFGDD
jgi:hypothetical protein